MQLLQPDATRIKKCFIIQIKPTRTTVRVGFVLVWHSDCRTRKAALDNMPVACRNRRGFSAEKRDQ